MKVDRISLDPICPKPLIYAGSLSLLYEGMANAPDIRFFRDRKGQTIAYSRHGEGPLVICPAWWVSHVEKDWGHESFQHFFSLLGEGVSLVRYDRHGVGLSDREIVSQSLEDEAALLEDLTAELGEERYSFFAVSCGAPTAVLHAARHPERVERICFYGAYADGQTLCPPEVQQAVYATVKAHWGMGSRALADIFLPDVDRDVVKAFARHQRDAAEADVAAELLKLTYAIDARSYLTSVTCPALLLHRRHDRAIPFEAARVLAAAIKDARLVSMTGASHPPWVNGDEIAQTANRFLRGQETLVAATVKTENGASGLDEANRCLRLAGERVELTPLEYAVMAELIAAKDQIVTRDDLLERVWKQPFEGSNRIDTLIRGLRKKLGDYASSIETVRGHGYRFGGWSQGEAQAGSQGK